MPALIGPFTNKLKTKDQFRKFMIDMFHTDTH